MSIFAMPANFAGSAPGRRNAARASRRRRPGSRSSCRGSDRRTARRARSIPVIRRRPEAARVPEADTRCLPGSSSTSSRVDLRDAGLSRRCLEMMKCGVSYGNGIAQRNWPLARVVHPDAAALAHRDRDVALLAFAHVGVDPLHVARIGRDGRAESVFSWLMSMSQSSPGKCW